MLNGLNVNMVFLFLLKFVFNWILLVFNLLKKVKLLYEIFNLLKIFGMIFKIVLNFKFFV